MTKGPLPVFPSGAPPQVGELLKQIRLGPRHPEEHVFSVRVPFDGQSAAVPFARQVVSNLYAAVAAVHSAAGHATESELSVFEGTVRHGAASANLSEAFKRVRRTRVPSAVRIDIPLGPWTAIW